jgi:hypothetical protein
MALPDRLADDQLAQHGFIKVSDRKAKHRQYNSFLNLCESCGVWCKQLEGGQEKICRECRRAKRTLQRSPAPSEDEPGQSLNYLNVP